jgi:hypothetical protein
MSSQHPLDTESARDYAAAYATHYTRRDLLRALQAYDQVIELCPTAPEAEYSRRSQMRNIVKLVVPARELLASQVELVRQHLQRVDDPSAATVSP